MAKKQLTYKAAGVDIDTANETKQELKRVLETKERRVLNTVGAFASLYDAHFPEYEHPVLVLKTEEPGSKQKLAFENDSVETICHDLVNHLVNDAIVMGARPLSVQDCIVCGKLEKDVIVRVVAAMRDACKKNDCVLTGGETSEQPRVVPAGTYILTASIVGIVERSRIIDGTKIQKGDIVIALASNGLHTNGYTLVRKLMEESPQILDEKVGGKSFVDAILTPHRAYYPAVRELFASDGLVGLAHITGGGIKENLNRILPKELDAKVDLSRVRILPIFQTVRHYSGSSDADMLRTFNMGVGLVAVVRPGFAEEALAHFKAMDVEAYEVGTIVEGQGNVTLMGSLQWE